MQTQSVHLNSRRWIVGIIFALGVRAASANVPLKEYTPIADYLALKDTAVTEVGVPNSGGSNLFTFPISPSFPSHFIRMAAIGRTDVRQTANLIFDAGDLNGQCERINAAQYHSMSVQQLRDKYDVLLFSVDYPRTQPPVNAAWTERLLPYLMLGGGIVWENNLDCAKLAPEITANTLYNFSGTVVSPQVPGLTDGITDNFINLHHCYTNWNARLKPFLKFHSATVGLYGEYPGGGRIVLTGPDNDAHGILVVNGDYGVRASNQYRLLQNEILWVFSGRK